MTRQLIAVATSVLTLVGMWLAGSKRASGWGVGLANQALWFAFIVAFGAWGLLPLNVALVGIYSRNLRRWRREEDQLERVSEALERTSLAYIEATNPGIDMDEVRAIRGAT